MRLREVEADRQLQAAEAVEQVRVGVAANLAMQVTGILSLIFVEVYRYEKSPATGWRRMGTGYVYQMFGTGLALFFATSVIHWVGLAVAIGGFALIVRAMAEETWSHLPLRVKKFLAKLVGITIEDPPTKPGPPPPPKKSV